MSKEFNQKKLPRLQLIVAALLIGLIGSYLLIHSKADTISPSIYWGSWIDGDVYSSSDDAPWGATTWDTFEQHTGKQVSIDHFGQPPPWSQAFAPGPLNLTVARGAIPMMDMSSQEVSLTDITNGTYDSSITTWAKAVKSWGKPFFFRWNWEMNGTWYSWGSQAQQNPANYTAAWKHFHDVVAAQGANNVTWVWCPNTIYSGSTPLSQLYPGDNYVDWTCMDAYNRGTNPYQPDSWKSFQQIAQPTYDSLLQIAPNKPIMIGETASTEYGGSKASWITNTLADLPTDFPNVKAFVWFNWNIDENGGRMDWPIESSPSAQTAFANAIASPVYASNTFGNLPALTKVQPLSASSPPPDTTAPTVSVTAPANNATASGASTTVSANATDDTGVSGVQFKLDGNNLGSEDTSSPYATTWNTTTAANGTHTLTAIARDAAGNTKTSASVTVTVDNGGGGTGACAATATSASALRTVIQNNSGKTVCVQGNVGDVDLSSIRPAQTVTVIPAANGGSLGWVNMPKAANITIDGLRLESASISGDASNVANNLTIRDCQAGGTSSNRVVVFAVFDIRQYSQNILISGCDIGWTAQGGGDNGYGVRAVNGDAGPITNVTVEKSKLHNLTSDGIQLAGVNNFTLDRSEIAYAAVEPGGPANHVDSIQILSQSGTNRYTNNWIHHTGYYSDTVIPGPAGQWIMHDSASGSMLVENNLITDNQNYTPNWSGVPSNVTLQNNTIVRNALAFGTTDSVQWKDGAGTGKLAKDNIIAGMGGASNVSFSGNVWTLGGTRGSTDIAQQVSFDADREPTNLPSSHAGAGYRCPAAVSWCTPGSTTPPPADTTAPTVSFTAPTNGSTVSGIVTATAAASDDVGVTKVELSLDGALKMTDTDSPYNYSFDSKTLTNGSHSLSAKAYDAAGNTKSTTITVTVNNPDITPPNAPTNLNATAPNATTVSLTWSASTDTGANQTGVTKYNVLRNGVVIAQPTTTSYSDTNRTANTTYSYVVQAVDGANNVSSSSNAATVTTPLPPTTPDTTAPAVPTSLHAAAASASQINLTWIASTDSGGSGLAGYNIYRNGTKLNSAPINSTSYGDSTVSSGTTYSYKIEAVDGAGNKSAQTSAVSVTTATAKRGDVTGGSGAPDGIIDLRDLSYLIRNYNTNNSTADISGSSGTPDGKVDIYDLSYLIRNYER